MSPSHLTRILITLTLLATFITCTTLVFARGRSGGNRQRAGGRANSTSGRPTRTHGVPGNAKHGNATRGNANAVGKRAGSVGKGVPATRMLQLAINHQGDLRGTYYDSLTNTSQNIAGQLNRQTQVAQWSLESNRKLTFEAPLEQLTQATGLVRVNLPTRSELWSLAQVDPSSVAQELP